MAEVPLRAALRRGLWTIGGLLLAVALAGAALVRTDLGQRAAAELIERTRPPLLLASLAVMSLGMLFVALRWRTLIPDHKPPALGLTAIACSALLVNYALPGPVGELAAAGLARRRYGIPAGTALAASLYGRFIGLGMAGLGTGLLWLSGALPVPPSASPLVGLAAILIAIGALGGALLALRPRWLHRLSASTAGRLARRGGRAGRWAGQLHAGSGTLVGALERIGRLPARSWALAAAWALCGHGCVATGIWLGAISIGAAPAWGGVLFTYLASAAAVIALFALPGAQLGWDALFFGFLTATAGVDAADALAITALQRIQQILLLLIGAVALAWLLAARQSAERAP